MTNDEQWIRQNIWHNRANESPGRPSEDFGAVKAILSALKPGPVNSAAEEYQKASTALAEFTSKLEGYADKLIKHWKGESAQQALDQLGQVHRTAASLSDKSLQTANSFKWYGTEILQWYKDVGTTMEDGWVSTGGDDDFARDYLQKLRRRTAEGHNAVPREVEKDLPEDHGGNQPPPGGPPGGGPGGGGPGGMPGGGGSMPGGQPSPFASPDGNRNPHLDPGSFPGGGPGSSDLAGVGSGPGGPSFGSGAGGGSNLSSMGDPGGSPPGLGGGGGGSGLPGGQPGGLGAGGGAMGAGGMGPGGMAAGARGAGAAGRMGGMPMGGMPMGGGAGNQGDQERERETWLTEDEDVWGADDDTAPPVIG